MAHYQILWMLESIESFIKFEKFKGLNDENFCYLSGFKEAPFDKIFFNFKSPFPRSPWMESPALLRTKHLILKSSQLFLQSPELERKGFFLPRYNSSALARSYNVSNFQAPNRIFISTIKDLLSI